MNKDIFFVFILSSCYFTFFTYRCLLLQIDQNILAIRLIFWFFVDICINWMAKNTIFMIITTVINDINKTNCKFLKTSPGLMQITLKLMCAILHEIYEFCCRHPHRTTTMCNFFLRHSFFIPINFTYMFVWLYMSI